MKQTTRRIAISGLAAIAITGGTMAAYASTTSTAPSAPLPGYGYSGKGPLGGLPAGAKPPTPGPHLAGTVVSSSGSKIIITDRDGFQRTIDVSSSTKYSDGITATVAKGTKISAAGKVDSDKTSLDATTVGKMPTGGPGMGHGPGGGPGMGGPGRGGPGMGGLGEGAPSA